MIKIAKFSTVLAFSLALAACSGDADTPEADNVTETKMDEVDVIDGTISDDMVDVDTQKTGDPMEEGGEEEENTAKDDEKGNGEEAESAEE